MISAHASELWNYVSSQLKEAAGYLARVQEIIASAAPETFDVLQLKDGRVFEQNSAIQLIKQRNVGRVWSFRDITQRKRAQDALANEKRVLQEIASGAPLATVLDVLVRGVEAQTCDGMICRCRSYEDAQCLREGAAPDLPEGYNRIVDGLRIGPRVGSCGSAAYKRGPVLRQISPAILIGPITSNWLQRSDLVPAVRHRSSPAMGYYWVRSPCTIVARTNPVRMIGSSSAWRRIWQVSSLNERAPWSNYASPRSRRNNARRRSKSATARFARKMSRWKQICEWRQNCSRPSCRARIRLFRQTQPRAERSSVLSPLFGGYSDGRRFLSYRTA